MPVADPRTSTVPDVVPATSTATDSSPVAAASQSHTLSKGAIAGAVIGAVAGAVLFVALAALALTKVPLSIPVRHQLSHHQDQLQMLSSICPVLNIVCSSPGLSCAGSLPLFVTVQAAGMVMTLTCCCDIAAEEASWPPPTARGAFS